MTQEARVARFVRLIEIAIAPGNPTPNPFPSGKGNRILATIAEGNRIFMKLDHSVMFIAFARAIVPSHSALGLIVRDCVARSTATRPKVGR